MQRYVKAFFIALKMTLRGESPPAHPHQALLEWVHNGQILAQKTLTTAEKAGYTLDKRKSIKLRVDGREESMETILRGIAYHFQTEYPYLLRHLTNHSSTAIYASNMNDQYGLLKLQEVDFQKAAELNTALNTLLEHLRNPPPSQ